MPSLTIRIDAVEILKYTEGGWIMLNEDSLTLSKSLTVLFAVGAAIAVANLYYNQPILGLLGKTFGKTTAQSGLLSTLTQTGYALGLLFIAPLGDMVPRKPLLILLSFISAVILLFMAFAPSMAVLYILSLLLGIVTVIPQILVPTAADLAADHQRGKVIGTVMGGLLLGVLAARTISGFIAAISSWRTVFFVAALAMLVLAIIFLRYLRALPRKQSLRYSELYRSMFLLWRAHSILRQASLIGAMLFGAFSVLWTVLSFRLTAPPYHVGSAVVGLFGLVGMAGAIGAPITGRISDIRGPRFMIAVGILTVLASYIILLFFSNQLLWLIVGIIALDFGTQAGQISNQARIYALNSSARSRLTSIYMVIYFFGGALGSGLGSLFYGIDGFTGACIVALVLVITAYIIHVWPTRA